ncbi:MAG: TetR/AcrR family transcriptional regulator [Acidobacteriota bacterium]
MIANQTPAARRKSPKRKAVIRAATEEFLQGGFSGTSMDRIADVAQVSKRTVYNHFPSKDDLFQAIIEELLQRTDEMPFHGYSKDEPLEDQLERIGVTFAETITGEDFMKLCRVVVSRFIQAPEWAGVTLTAYAKLRVNLRSWLKACEDDGRLQIPDFDRAETQFCGLIKEFVFWPELMAGQEPASSSERNTVVKSAVDVFLTYYGAPTDVSTSASSDERVSLAAQEGS